MTGILADAGIAGPLPDIYDFNGHIKLPPALMPTGRTLRTRNVHNCAAEKFNEESVDMTSDCHDNASRMVTQDVEPPLKPLYGILQEEFEELVFSEQYCMEVGPLPLFLRKKIVRECLTNAGKSEKDKAGKEKAGKSIRGSMVMEKPITHVPGQRPDIDIADIVLYSISNKLYLPINWFTNIHLDHIQHHLHELHTKLNRPDPSTDVPNPDKIQVFNMAKMAP